MACQEIIGCLTVLTKPLPICSKNCEMDPAVRNQFTYMNNIKRINNSVRISSGLYQHNISSAVVIAQSKCSNKPTWHQASDRVVAGQPTAYVPRRRMGIRPGGLGTGGKNASGVDVKHNSYARFLARKRGSC